MLERWASAGVTPAAILVDAHVPGQFGGTGKTAPWHLLADFKPNVPLILAGGLTPENVAEAIRIVRPYAVDVTSGVEASPGKKDADKTRRFINAVRSV
jgi:phosphoribosylanthranilate isomerase